MINFRENILKARSQIAFMIGLCLAAILALAAESRVDIDRFRSAGSFLVQPSDGQTPLGPTGNISQKDYRNAYIAWAYFDRNFQPETGLVNSVDGFPSTTIWDQSSYLLGLISAYRLKLVDQELFDQRLGLALATLADLPLFDEQLPNKVYDTRTLVMTDYANTPTFGGIGWSALDVARMTVPLNLILYDYPDHAAGAAKILQRWNFRAMVQNGTMYGSRIDAETGETELIQEGRLGYEEYAARAMGLLGLDTLSAAKYDDFVRFVDIEGQQVAVDSRSREIFDAHTYVVSEPYILTAIEFGFDRESQELAHRIYQAQAGRYKTTGILTAVSEDNINQEPYFIYNTVYANGKKWNVLGEDGLEYDALRTVSTKAVFGWDAIYRSPYTADLMDHISQTSTEDRGWVSGIYEGSGKLNDVATANTNGIILEAIQYRANGPLVTARFQSN